MKKYDRNYEVIRDFLDEGKKEVDIAKKFSISRQRVHQILKRNGVNTTQELQDRRMQSMGYCLNCYKLIPPKRKFCNTECFSAFHRIPVKCANCGKVFSKPLSQVEEGQADCCSSECKYTYIGKLMKGGRKIGRKKAQAIEARKTSKKAKRSTDTHI